MVSFRRKNNDERTNSIFQKNEKLSFLNANDIKTNDLKLFEFELEENRFFTELTILLNKRFY